MLTTKLQNCSHEFATSVCPYATNSSKRAERICKKLHAGPLRRYRSSCDDDRTLQRLYSCTLRRPSSALTETKNASKKSCRKNETSILCSAHYKGNSHGFWDRQTKVIFVLLFGLILVKCYITGRPYPLRLFYQTIKFSYHELKFRKKSRAHVREMFRHECITQRAPLSLCITQNGET